MERLERTVLPWTNWTHMSPSTSSLAFVMVEEPVTPYGEFMMGKPVPPQPPMDTNTFWSYSPVGDMINLFYQEAVEQQRDIYFAGYKLTESQGVQWIGFVFRWLFAHARRLHSEKSSANYHLVPECFRQAQSDQFFAISNYLELPLFRTMRHHLFANFFGIPSGSLAMSHAATRTSVSLPKHWVKPQWGHKTCPGP